MDELERQFQDLCVDTRKDTTAGDRECKKGNFVKAGEYYESALEGCRKKLALAMRMGEPERVLRKHDKDLEEAEYLADKAYMRHLQKQYERDRAAAVQFAKRPLIEGKTLNARTALIYAKDRLLEMERKLPGVVARDYPGVMRELDDQIRELAQLDAGLLIIRDMTLHLRDADAAITSGDAITARMSYDSGCQALEEGYNRMPAKYRPGPEHMSRFREQVGTLQARADQRFGFRMW